jgi:hypothetical protein
MARTGQGDDDAQLIPPVAATDLTYGDDDLLALGDERTLPPWSIVTGSFVLLALVIGLVALKWDGRHATGQPSGVPSGTPIESQQVQPIGTPIDLGQTSAVSVELAAGRLFVLSSDPWRLFQIDAKTGLSRRQVPAPLGSEHLVADSAGRILWVVAGARVFAYDAATLAPLGRLEISRDVVAAATLDGRLFIDTDHGIYMARPRDSVPTSLGYSGQVLQDLSADPARHRLLGVTVGYQLLEVTTRGVQIKQKLTELLPKSIAVTKAGIWAVGFGPPGGSRIARLDPDTLKLTPVGAGDGEAPQGADGWSGESVIWTRFPYLDSITCRDERTGAIVGSFPNTIDQVVSTRGMAYGLSGGIVVRLQTTRTCPG